MHDLIKISLMFFILYYILIVGAEQLADKNQLNPILSMWLPNIILGTLGIYLIYKNSKNRSKIKFDFLEVPNFWFTHLGLELEAHIQPASRPNVVYFHAKYELPTPTLNGRTRNSVPPKNQTFFPGI